MMVSSCETQERIGLTNGVEMTQRESKSASVGVVTKVLHILETLHASDRGLHLREVAQLTGINKSTAYRFLAHLEHEGYVFRDGAGAYAIGVRMARLGSGVSYHATLRKIVHPVIESLWRATGETVNMAVMDGHEVLYLDVLESAHTFRLVTQVGARRPIHCTALGKAMLPFYPPDEQECIVGALNFERFTVRTIAKPLTFKKELALIRQRGFSIDDEESYLGSRCIGVPIFDETGTPAAGLSVSGPTMRVTRERVAAFAATARQAAAAASKSLGYSPAKTMAAARGM
jgi:IclR family KDG regulon transcriptional repressor